MYIETPKVDIAAWFEPESSKKRLIVDWSIAHSAGIRLRSFQSHTRTLTRHARPNNQLSQELHVCTIWTFIYSEVYSDQEEFEGGKILTTKWSLIYSATYRMDMRIWCLKRTRRFRKLYTQVLEVYMGPA